MGKPGRFLRDFYSWPVAAAFAAGAVALLCAAVVVLLPMFD